MKKFLIATTSLFLATSISVAQQNEPEIKLPTTRAPIAAPGPSGASNDAPKPAQAVPVQSAQEAVQTYVDPEIERETRRAKKETHLNSINLTRLNSQLEVKKIEAELAKLENEQKKIQTDASAANGKGNTTGGIRPEDGKSADGMPVITVDSIYGADNNLKATLKIEGYGRVVLKIGQSVPLTQLSVKTIDTTGVTLSDKENVVYTVPFSS